jgi:hypothetical protein
MDIAYYMKQYLCIKVSMAVRGNCNGVGMRSSSCGEIFCEHYHLCAPWSDQHLLIPFS